MNFSIMCIGLFSYLLTKWVLKTPPNFMETCCMSVMCTLLAAILVEVSLEPVTVSIFDYASNVIGIFLGYGVYGILYTVREMKRH